MKHHSINTKAPLVSAVNGKVEKLGVSFRSFAKKSAKCVLGMAEIVVKAKDLTPAEFRNFCDLVGLDPGSSRIRKLLVIGNNVDKLKIHLKSLPPNWTTIYEIAQMDDDLICRLVDGGSLTTSSTAASIRASSKPNAKSSKMNAPSPRNATSEGTLQSFFERDGLEVIAHFKDWLCSDRVKVLSEACDALRSIGAEVQFGDVIEDMIEEASPDDDCAINEEVEDAHA